MAETTRIEWADKTFNPWIGCTEVSPACDNCYARTQTPTRALGITWGSGQKRHRTSDEYWRSPKRWNKIAASQGLRPFVFCASLADVFDNEVDPAWRTDLFTLICETPHLVWLLLTKRIGNVEKMVGLGQKLPANVAIGATMANQKEYDRDATSLAIVKANIRPIFTFGSFEPMLGSITIDEFAPDWIIVGGESGPNARPMSVAWARDLRDDAKRLGRVFNFKQHGGTDRDKGGHWLDGCEHLDRPVVPAMTAAGEA